MIITINLWLSLIATILSMSSYIQWSLRFCSLRIVIHILCHLQIDLPVCVYVCVSLMLSCRSSLSIPDGIFWRVELLYMYSLIVIIITPLLDRKIFNFMSDFFGHDLCFVFKKSFFMLSLHRYSPTVF